MFPEYKLFDAIYRGNQHEIMLALNDGADVEIREHGRSVLRAAAELCNLNIVLYLLEHGCNPNERINHRQESLLHWAVNTERQLILETLVSHGAKVDARDSNWRTPLHVAAKKNSLGCLVALIKSDANLEARDSLGDTPLHVAARRGNVEAVTELLRYGAEVDSLNRLGESPWTLAHHNRMVNVCRRLIEYGADESCVRRKQQPSPERLPSGQFLLPLQIDDEPLTAASFASRVRVSDKGRER